MAVNDTLPHVPVPVVATMLQPPPLTVSALGLTDIAEAEVEAQAVYVEPTGGAPGAAVENDTVRACLITLIDCV